MSVGTFLSGTFVYLHTKIKTRRVCVFALSYNPDNIINTHERRTTLRKMPYKIAVVDCVLVAMLLLTLFATRELCAWFNKASEIITQVKHNRDLLVLIDRTLRDLVS